MRLSASVFSLPFFLCGNTHTKVPYRPFLSFLQKMSEKRATCPLLQPFVLCGYPLMRQRAYGIFRYASTVDFCRMAIRAYHVGISCEHIIPPKNALRYKQASPRPQTARFRQNSFWGGAGDTHSPRPYSPPPTQAL